MKKLSAVPDPSDKHKAFKSISDLKHDREIAAALGDMIVAWASAERVLHDVARTILGVQHLDAQTLLSWVPTFESRIKVIRALLADWRPEQHDVAAISKELNKLAKLAGTRNGWVHRSWGAAIDNSLTVVFDFRAPLNSSARRKLVKAHDVIDHTKTVTDIAWRLAKLL